MIYYYQWLHIPSHMKEQMTKCKKKRVQIKFNSPRFQKLLVLASCFLVVCKISMNEKL